MNDWQPADCGAALVALILLWGFLSHPHVKESLLLSAGISICFALAAWVLKGVSLSGAFAGAIVAFVFYAGDGWRSFFLILFVFVITWIPTRLRSARLGSLEQPRTAVQIMANLLVPCALFIGSIKLGFIGGFPMIVAALSELAADTVSSEIGEAYGRSTYLITTFKKVESGTNGAISLIGTFAGLLSALLVIGANAALFPLDSSDSSFYLLWAPLLGGIIGMFADSLLGATLERRGWMNNEAVNFVGTGTAALIPLALVLLFGS